MKKITWLLSLLILLPFIASGQMKKESVEDFFSEINVKSAQLFTVEKFIGFSDASNRYKYNSVGFDNKTVEIVFKEDCLRINDESGTIMYLPYSEIKTLEFRPKTINKQYTEIIICID